MSSILTSAPGDAGRTVLFYQEDCLNQWLLLTFFSSARITPYSDFFRVFASSTSPPRSYFSQKKKQPLLLFFFFFSLFLLAKLGVEFIQTEQATHLKHHLIQTVRIPFWLHKLTLKPVHKKVFCAKLMHK